MVARRRTPKPEADEGEVLAREGFEELTPDNADDQFGKLLGVLDRIDDTLFDTVVVMRKNRKLIDAGLKRIGRRGDEIDRALAEMKHG